MNESKSNKSDSEASDDGDADDERDDLTDDDSANTGRAASDNFSDPDDSQLSDDDDDDDEDAAVAVAARIIKIIGQQDYDRSQKIPLTLLYFCIKQWRRIQTKYRKHFIICLGANQFRKLNYEPFDESTMASFMESPTQYLKTYAKLMFV